MPYLADTSIWGWARGGRRAELELKLAARIERREVATCVPIALEVMHRASTGEEYEFAFETLLAPLDWLPVGEEATRRALDVQRALAQVSHGRHFRPAVDFLVAATAEVAGPDVVLWGIDRDLRVICDYTGQPFEGE